ncbi:phenylalanine--tRNA ligase beta subunit-related protein, partial [Salmonella enterica]|uniref:phenylalanine--tRNA ligase beta subunit-related protein n=1 Tax=Salmonella enterica TaxID=28901 RepID=UPI000CBE26CA
TDDTNTIALESAVFKPALIRRTANTMNLRSEASSRYEKGINIATVGEALDLAAQLIAEIVGGEVVSETASADNVEPEDVKVTASMKRINDLIGDELT